jgi:hypothetical protein
LDTGFTGAAVLEFSQEDVKRFRVLVERVLQRAQKLEVALRAVDKFVAKIPQRVTSVNDGAPMRLERYCEEQRAANSRRPGRVEVLSTQAVARTDSRSEQTYPWSGFSDTKQPSGGTGDQDVLGAHPKNNRDLSATGNREVLGTPAVESGVWTGQRFLTWSQCDAIARAHEHESDSALPNLDWDPGY